MQVTIALLLLLSVHLVSTSECPQGWRVFQDNCYLFVNRLENWQAAAGSCASNQAHLPIVENERMERWLETQMSELAGKSFWLGGKYNPTIKDWQWQPSGVRIVRFNWAAGEPNDPARDSCLELRTSPSIKWNDTQCSQTLRFACQKPAMKVPEVPAVTEAPEVTPTKWLEFMGFRYFFYPHLKNWKDAQATCARNKGARLPVNKDRLGYYWLVSKMLKQSMKNYWLGGSYVANGSYWEWKPSGERISGFMNWGNNQTHYPSTQHCMAAKYSQALSWTYASCAEKLHFACQKAV